MYLKAKDYCAGRTSDGRMFVVMSGTTTIIDEDDAPMVELVKAWVDAGAAEVPDTDEAEAEVGPPHETVETPPAAPVKKAAATKAATRKAAE